VTAFRGSGFVATAAFFSLLVFNFAPADGTTISANTANHAADLGYAYQSEKEAVVGSACVKGKANNTSGTPNATFSFDQSLSEQQASKELGVGAGGRARFGVVEASATATFMQNAVSDDYSISGVWLSEYRLPTEILENPSPNEIGTSVRGNDERWAQTCGDEFVSEITRGAKLFFSIRVDFSSKEEKRSFSSQFTIAGPLFSAEGNLNSASREFSRNTKVTVAAFQLGGDVSKLTGIFPDTDTGRAGFVQCTLGDFSKCADMISSALKYATDLKEGFPSQIAPGATPGAAAIEYITSKYESIGIYPSNYPFLDQANAEARSTLADDFEQQFKLKVLADRLITSGLGVAQSAIESQQSIITANVGHILDASEVCYNTPLLCFKTVANLKIAVVDKGVLALPPAPTASFRLLTTSKGVWSRADSVAYMRTPQRLWTCIDFTLCSLDFSPDDPWYNDGPATAGYGYGMRLPNIYDVEKNGAASIVLYVEGVGLEDALVFFEGQQLADLPIAPGSSPFPGKIGDGFASLVIETTRPDPKWRDINLETLMIHLSNTGLPAGDGVFYVVIRDALGRETTFDLRYVKWETSMWSDKQRVLSLYDFRDRWWDPNSGGTSVHGSGNWTEDYASGRPAKPHP
jgi:hypothetical protein